MILVPTAPCRKAMSREAGLCSWFHSPILQMSESEVSAEDRCRRSVTLTLKFMMARSRSSEIWESCSRSNANSLIILSCNGIYDFLHLQRNGRDHRSHLTVQGVKQPA